MEILPTSLGTRPKLAVEIRWGGVVAARSEDAVTGQLTAVSRVMLGAEALEPGLKAGNMRSHAAIVAAVRRSLEAVSEKSAGRVVTLVVPDATVRVLLLDFDTLPTKPAEALPVVRFRLKKLLPFEADNAALSYQIMQPSAGTRARGDDKKGLVRVVAVAMPREVLDEYEAVVREAGFEPGAVMSSTIAALAGLEERPTAELVVNAGPQFVTTAIVEEGLLLLHRSVDLSGNVQVGILAEAVAAQPEAFAPLLPLVDPIASQQEWAMQEPVDPFGRDQPDPFAHDLAAAIEAEAVAEFAGEQGASVLVVDVMVAEQELGGPTGQTGEVTQAVSVAAAYFEDTLQQSPTKIYSAGSTSAAELERMLGEAGFGAIVSIVATEDGTGAAAVAVEELVDSDALGAQASSAQVPRAWLAGVRGALRS